MEPSSTTLWLMESQVSRFSTSLGGGAGQGPGLAFALAASEGYLPHAVPGIGSQKASPGKSLNSRERLPRGPVQLDAWHAKQEDSPSGKCMAWFRGGRLLGGASGIALRPGSFGITPPDARGE